MSRPLVILLAVIAVIVVAVFLLAGRSGERPQARVETPVTLANLT